MGVGTTSQTERKVCHCDDPECSGFIEEVDNVVIDHTAANDDVDLNSIEDDYMRRSGNFLIFILHDSLW